MLRATGQPLRRTETSEALWEQLPSGRVAHRFEWVVLSATLALIPVLILENDAKSQKWQDIAYGANWVIWAVFALELTFILIVAPRKGAALRAHWVDAILVEPTWHCANQVEVVLEPAEHQLRPSRVMAAVGCSGTSQLTPRAKQAGNGTSL